MKEKGLKWYLYNLSVDYDDIIDNDVEDIYEYLMKNTILFKCKR